MPVALQVLLLMLASYVIGGIPMGLLVARAKGVDIRKKGSGNIGATNVGRVLGMRFGVLVLLMDATKGAATSLGAAWFVANVAGVAQTASATPDLVRLGVAIACVFGNTASIFLGFKGGKGVATALGVLLGTYPYLTWPVLICGGLWAAVVLATRYVSLGSIIAALATPPTFLAFAWWLKWDLGEHWPLMCLTIVLATVVVVRHRSNIGRLRDGTESRVGRSKSDGVAQASE